MAKSLYNDRGQAERAVLYGKAAAAEQKKEPDYQGQIVKLLEQVKNRLGDIERERNEVWDTINDQSRTLMELEDRSNSTEKTYISLENRLSRSELKEAPIEERLDEIERKTKDAGQGGSETLRLEILERIEHSDLQTTRLIERIDEAMVMQGRMTRRLDKVVQDKQRLARKMAMLEESMDATRQALSAKALVLLSDKGVLSADMPKLPVFSESSLNDNTFIDEDGDSVRISEKAAHMPRATMQGAMIKSFSFERFKSPLLAGAAFVLIAATVGWTISQKLSETITIPSMNERLATTTVPQAAATVEIPRFDMGETTQSEVHYLPNDARSMTDTEIATALNDIEPGVSSEVADMVQIDPQETGLVTPDPALPEALVPLEAAAMQGKAEAQHDLAAMYTAGHGGMQPNYQRAAYWFEKASNQGVANARYNLGVLYHQGLGVGQDIKKAIEWYQKAAQIGHPEAQYNLGIAYIEGIGVDYDPKMAADYFESAAASGIAEAAFNLGLIYENGLLGDPQSDEALLWYKTASDLGSQEAGTALEQLAKALNIKVEEIDNLVEKIRTPGARNEGAQGTQSYQTVENVTPSAPKAAVQQDPQLSEIQKNLIELGLYPGPVTGLNSPLTSDAIRLYQARNDIPVTGEPSDELLMHMSAKNLRNSVFPQLGSRE